MEEILNFLKEISRNNNREWFASNKDRWRRVDHLADELTQDIINGMASFEPDVKKLTPKDCRYRIYRDTRFSLDKTPYKTHIGIFINPPYGKKSLRAGYYLHLEPGNCFGGGGVWCPPPALLKAIRNDIYNEIEEYLGIVRNPDFAKAYPAVGEDLLKTAPKGFPKDWEYIDMLKPRSFTVISNLFPEKLVKGRNFIPHVVEMFRLQKPFNDFMNYTVDESGVLS